MRNCIIHLKNSISIALCSAYIEFTQSDYGIVFGIRPYAGYRALLPFYARILMPSLEGALMMHSQAKATRQPEAADYQVLRN